MEACGFNSWLSGYLRGFGRVVIISLGLCKVRVLIRWWSFKSCHFSQDKCEGSRWGTEVLLGAAGSRVGHEWSSEAGVKSLA